MDEQMRKAIEERTQQLHGKAKSIAEVKPRPQIEVEAEGKPEVKVEEKKVKVKTTKK